jgi:hypothetical protein
MRSSRWLTLHHDPQNAVDARLVALAVALEPIEYVLIETDRQLLFRGRPGHRRLLEKGLVEPWNVRVVNLQSFIRSIRAKSLAFLITTDLLLTSVSLLHGDDARRLIARRMGYDDKTPGEQTQSNELFFAVSETVVFESDAGTGKYLLGIFKTEAVLGDVFPVLRLVPFVFHSGSNVCSSFCSYRQSVFIRLAAASSSSAKTQSPQLTSKAKSRTKAADKSVRSTRGTRNPTIATTWVLHF